MRNKIANAVVAISAAIALAACGKPAGRQADPPAPEVNATGEDRAPGADPVLDYRAAAELVLADPLRPAADREKDAARKAAEALAFMEIAPGAVIFEIEAGSGWYTELFSRMTGAGGAVIMQNPQGFLDFVSKDIDARLNGDRLPNVRQSISNFDQLGAEDASIDLATWVQGPHELYFKPSEGVTLGDPAASFDEIFRILKPGAALVVIDHSAEPGAPETTGDMLHRIDKAIVMETAEAAGLRLVDDADFLANPADDRKASVFDPAIRGRTDQFVLRFKKPYEATRPRPQGLGSSQSRGEERRSDLLEEPESEDDLDGAAPDEGQVARTDEEAEEVRAQDRRERIQRERREAEAREHHKRHRHGPVR